MNERTSDRTPITARLMSGLIVLTLGVLWMLDNLGRIDASEFVRWWPAVALGWGLMLLAGIGHPRRPISGTVWSVVGLIGLLNMLDFVPVSPFDLWPLALVALGVVLVVRSVRHGSASPTAPDGTASGPRLDAFSFLGAAQRKVVAQDFRSGDVSAVMGGGVIDFRSAALAGGRAEINVFVALGGVDIIVPAGWRVVGQVTPMLGAFQDLTATPTDASAPLLVIRGTVFLGGVEILNEPRPMGGYGSVRVDTRGPRARRVVVGPGGVFVGAVVGRGDEERTRGSERGTERGPERGPDRDSE